MKHMIVLDARSIAGGIYLDKSDGYIMASGVKHPALLCTDLDLNNPYYIYATLPPREGRECRSLHLPHGSIAAIYEFRDDSEKAQIGFVAAA